MMFELLLLLYTCFSAVFVVYQFFSVTKLRLYMISEVFHGRSLHYEGFRVLTK